MTLADAKALRDMIRAAGLACTVPLGHGPTGYFARIWSAREGNPGQPVDFRSEGEWLAWKRRADEEDRKAELRRQLLSRPRSPLDVLIDRACGLE